MSSWGQQREQSVGWMAWVIDDPPGFPHKMPGVDVLEGGKLTSNNVAGQFSWPFAELCGCQRYVFQTRWGCSRSGCSPQCRCSMFWGCWGSFQTSSTVSGRRGCVFFSTASVWADHVRSSVMWTQRNLGCVYTGRKKSDLLPTSDTDRNLMHSAHKHFYPIWAFSKFGFKSDTYQISGHTTYV